MTPTATAATASTTATAAITPTTTTSPRSSLPQFPLPVPQGRRSATRTSRSTRRPPFSTANATTGDGGVRAPSSATPTQTSRRRVSGIHTGRGASRARSGAPRRRRAARKPKVDKDLTLFEFVNCLAHLAFWRLNPQHGSKYNKRELTPVPQFVSMLLNYCFLPNAKRDTSAEFRKVLAEDADVQKVLQQNTPKLQEWLRPILRRERSAATPNPKMTYKLWVSLMDGPSPAEMAAAARGEGPKPACPKQVGNRGIMQESQITGDERTGRSRCSAQGVAPDPAVPLELPPLSDGRAGRVG